MFECLKIADYSVFCQGYHQTSGIGGRGVFLVYSPLAENFSKRPPGDFEASHHFVF